MALFNYATRELSAKIVYYGPGLSGKTTNIEMVHQMLKPEQKGRLISLPTETDRTLFFDFLPLDLGHIKGFKVRFHLYTVPGQVYYNATRRLVLQGVDGVVFVADSQVGMMDSNVESLRNLGENLATYGKKIEDLPFLLQYNKRDLRNIASVSDLSARLNERNVPVFEGIAKDGVGVTETLVAISRLVFASLRKTLLLPGDVAEAEEPEEIASVIGGKKPQMEEPEPLEEISEIEEIPEAPGAPGERETPEIRVEAEPAEGPDAIRAEEISDFEEVLEVQEIPEETEIPEGLELITPPREVSPASFPGDAPPGMEEVRQEAGPVEVPEEIEIEIPEEFDAPRPVKGSPPGVSMKVEGEGLTFLKFEDVSVSPEGHAVLNAVFLDAGENPVRIRIRISMEEGR